MFSKLLMYSKNVFVSNAIKTDLRRRSYVKILTHVGTRGTHVFGRNSTTTIFFASLRQASGKHFRLNDSKIILDELGLLGLALRIRIGRRILKRKKATARNGFFENCGNFRSILRVPRFASRIYVTLK